MRMSRIIRERMGSRDSENISPQSLISSRTVSTVIMSFFGSSQLSQFMDQINPLAEMTHKRRMSALGPEGLVRERAGFEVRDVHYTHYGRLCPIETPEGPNIGLISSLASYAKINPYGFIETPYRKVTNGVVGDDVVYLSADKEEDFKIAPASTQLDKNNKIQNAEVIVRAKGEFPLVHNKEVDYIDVSSQQLVSVASSLIPFLEHNDANRALMGSNMQRQAVPLLKAEAPIVATGMEGIVAKESGVTVRSRSKGKVIKVDASIIVIEKEKERRKENSFLEPVRYEEYPLHKFKRSNQDSCINQKPIVSIGDKVIVGQVIADGPSTDKGELALGKNIRVAFLPWNGYNYEDAIILSEDLAKRDIFTSIHIEEYTAEFRNTKLGDEELTRELPNVPEQLMANLDESGIVAVGTRVKSGDILVGKVTPKGETELSSEERLLRAIFGEKASDVRNTSLKAPLYMDGVVIDTQIFTKKRNDVETKKQNKKIIAQTRNSYQEKLDYILDSRNQKLKQVLQDQTAVELRDKLTDDIILKSGVRYKNSFFDSINWSDVAVNSELCKDKKANDIALSVLLESTRMIFEHEQKLQQELEKVEKGPVLNPGVLAMVKIFIAKKRKISVGDKMAGRHGNKGVVSKLVPVEDMPFDKDGTPVEILLNPLGVPSRMNVGQLLEMHLGYAAKNSRYSCFYSCI